MNKKKIVSLQVVREIRKAENGDPDYQIRVLEMNKLELLEEMMRFQEERSQTGELSLRMMIQGQILFKALEEAAETAELKDLTRSYRRHLKYELEAYFRNREDNPSFRESF
jgi:hypothetical protein